MTTSLNESRLWIARAGILLLLAAASVIAYLTRHSLAVANTTIQNELGINNKQFGLLYGAFSFGYMIFQIPGGWLGQRVGVRLALPLMAILWSIMTFATAFMATFATLLLVRLLFGIAQAGLVPNQALAVRDWMGDTSRGLASSVMVVAMSVGSVASMSLTSYLMKEQPWRSIFIAYSTIGVVWAVVFALVYRPSPPHVGWLHTIDDKPQLSPQPFPSATVLTETSVDAELQCDDDPQPLRSPSPLRFLSSLSMWGLGIQAMLKAAGYNLAVTFLPALLEYVHHVPPEKTGTLVTVSLVSFIIGSSLGGIVVDLVYRLTGSKYLSRSGLAASMLFVAAIFTSIAGYADTAMSTAAWLAVGAFFSGLASASPWVAVMDIGGKSTAVIMGFMNSFAALGGVLLTPFVGGIIDQIKQSNGDWSLVYLLHGGYYLFAALAWLVIDPRRTFEPEEPIHAV